MNKRDSLGDRMKQYEAVPKTILTRRFPVIIRLDGKAFHTFTRGMNKPYDDILMKTMQATMKYLCENIQGCVFGYTQSDEITLVLTDYATLETDAWFGYNVQKMTSVVASMATLIFNKEFNKIVDDFFDGCCYFQDMDIESPYCNILSKCCDKGAMFDARVFSLPREEVCNCLIWRQQDAIRNSIESAGQAQFSHKELYKKTCKQIQEMLITEKGIYWDDYPTSFKMGSACYKKPVEIQTENNGCVLRYKWEVDTEIPLFTEERIFVEKWI